MRVRDERYHAPSLTRRVLALALLASSACTALSDFAVHQCEGHADCDTLNGEVQRCEAYRCVDGCADNHHCASFDPRTPICPATGARCAALTSTEARCTAASAYDDATMGSLTGTDMTIVGGFAPSVVSSTWLTLELGANELNAARGSGAPELVPTLVVLCDDAAATVATSVDHLVHRLGARLLIASLDDIALSIATDQLSQDGEALLISPNAASARPRGDDADLIWYLGGQYADVVQAYPPLIRRTAELVEQQTGLANGLRIAQLVSSASEDSALAGAVAAAIELNGRDADYLFREDRFRRFELSDDSPSQRDEALEQLRLYAPDLILVFTGGTFSEPRGEPRSSAILSLEEGVGVEPGWAPRYVFGPRALNDETLLQIATNNPSFSARSLGLSADRTPDARLASALRSRFQSSFPDATLAGGASLHTYDALYQLVYAAAATQWDPGVHPRDAMLDGFARVIDYRGDCVDIGPEGIPAALQRISSEQPFELCGTTGPARFTPDHARDGDIQFFCWQSAAAGASRTVVIDNPLATTLGPLPEAACAENYLSLGSEP